MTQVRTNGQHPARAAGAAALLAAITSSSQPDICENGVGNGLKCSLEYPHPGDDCAWDGGRATLRMILGFLAVLVVAVIIQLSIEHEQALPILAIASAFVAALLVLVGHPRVGPRRSPYRSGGVTR